MADRSDNGAESGASQSIIEMFAKHGVGCRIVAGMSDADLACFEALVDQPYAETRHIFASMFHDYQESKKAAIDCGDDSK